MSDLSLFRARLSGWSLMLAAAVCTPLAARAQAQDPPQPAAPSCLRPATEPASAEERRHASAYARCVRQADRGDPAAASAALFMLHHGRALFGSDWSATERQQAHWHALSVNAARYRVPVVSNAADD